MKKFMSIWINTDYILVHFTNDTLLKRTVKVYTDMNVFCVYDDL